MVSHELTIILPLYILYAANFPQLTIAVWECRQPVDESAIHVTHLDVCLLHGSLQWSQRNGYQTSAAAEFVAKH